jgi:hypothetical protein
METPQFTDLFNQKVEGYAITGKVLLTMFLDSQGALLAYIQKCCENVNSALYREVLLKFHNAIHRKRPGQLARGILLYRDNARPQTAQARENSRSTVGNP